MEVSLGRRKNFFSGGGRAKRTLVLNPFVDDPVARIVVTDLRNFAFLVEDGDGFEFSLASGVGFFASENAFSVMSSRDWKDLFVCWDIDFDETALFAIEFGFDDQGVIVVADAIDVTVEVGVDFFIT